MKLPRMTALFAVPYRQMVSAGESSDRAELEGIRMLSSVYPPTGLWPYTDPSEFDACVAAWTDWYLRQQTGSGWQAEIDAGFDAVRKCNPLRDGRATSFRPLPGDIVIQPG